MAGQSQRSRERDLRSLLLSYTRFERGTAQASARIEQDVVELVRAAAHRFRRDVGSAGKLFGRREWAARLHRRSSTFESNGGDVDSPRRGFERRGQIPVFDVGVQA